MIRRLARRAMTWIRGRKRTVDATDGQQRPQELPIHKRATRSPAPAPVGPRLSSITSDVVVYETVLGSRPARHIMPIDRRASIAPPDAVVAGSFLPHVLRDAPQGASGWHETAPPSHFHQQAASSFCRLYELPHSAMGPVPTAEVLRALALGMVLLHRAGWSTNGRPEAWLWSDGTPAIWVDGQHRLFATNAGDGLGIERDEDMLRHFVRVTSGDSGTRRVRTVAHHSTAIRATSLGPSEIFLYLLGMSAPGIGAFADAIEGSDVMADIEIGCLLAGHGTDMVEAVRAIGAEVSPVVGDLARMLSAPRPAPMLVEV